MHAKFRREDLSRVIRIISKRLKPVSQHLLDLGLRKS